MRADHKAVFDRLGKALEREIAKCDIDLDPPRCQRKGWSDPYGAQVPWGLPMPVSPVLGNLKTMHVVDEFAGTYSLGEPGSLPEFFPPKHVPDLGQIVALPSMDEVEKFGTPKPTPKDLGHPGGMPLLAWLKAMKARPETKQERRAKRKGKG